MLTIGDVRESGNPKVSVVTEGSARRVLGEIKVNIGGLRTYMSRAEASRLAAALSAKVDEIEQEGAR